MRQCNGLHFTATNPIELELNNISYNWPVSEAMTLKNNNINSVSMIIVYLGNIIEIDEYESVWSIFLGINERQCCKLIWIA